MTNEDLKALQAEEFEAWTQYRNVLKTADIYRDKWLAIYKDWADELDHRRKETIAQIEQASKEDRLADYLRDRDVDRAA